MITKHQFKKKHSTALSESSQEPWGSGKEGVKFGQLTTLSAAMLLDLHVRVLKL